MEAGHHGSASDSTGVPTMDISLFVDGVTVSTNVEHRTKRDLFVRETGMSVSGISIRMEAYKRNQPVFVGKT